MAVSDPVADFLTRIRNSIRAEHRYVDVSWSKLKESLADILKSQGFVEDYLIKKDSPERGTIRVYLKYTHGRQPVIKGLKRVSRPGLRKYVGHEEIPQFFGGMGVSIVSTSQGLLPGKEAKKRKIGGELVCMVW
ncbi:MAG: 30S ribosomal protein S8 [Chlamydiia bacterium]|nr:30S ribosomal protein S8 [Chlamydiia bacterium]